MTGACENGVDDLATRQQACRATRRTRGGSATYPTPEQCLIKNRYNFGNVLSRGRPACRTSVEAEGLKPQAHSLTLCYFKRGSEALYPRSDCGKAGVLVSHSRKECFLRGRVYDAPRGWEQELWPYSTLIRK